MSPPFSGGIIQRETGLDVREVMRMLPHRYPFLLVDRVIDFESGKRIVTTKNVTQSEPHFTGHFHPPG